MFRPSLTLIRGTSPFGFCPANCLRQGLHTLTYFFPFFPPTAAREFFFTVSVFFAAVVFFAATAFFTAEDFFAEAAFFAVFSVFFKKKTGWIPLRNGIKEPRHDGMKLHGADAGDAFHLGQGFRPD